MSDLVSYLKSGEQGDQPSGAFWICFLTGRRN